MTTDIQQAPQQAMRQKQNDKPTGAQQLRDLAPHEGALNDLADVKATRGRRVILAIGQAMRANPALQECSPESVKAAAYKIAALDLDASGATGELWLVPIMGRVEVWPGVKGLLKLARRSGEVRTITTGAVREGDVFRYVATDTNQPLHHESRSGTASITAFWAQVELVTGGKIAAVVWADEFDGLVQAGQAKDRSQKGPWYKWPDRMVQLVAVRRSLKMAPQSVIQMPQQYALADDGRVESLPSSGRSAVAFVDETLAMTSDTEEAANV